MHICHMLYIDTVHLSLSLYPVKSWVIVASNRWCNWSTSAHKYPLVSAAFLAEKVSRLLGRQTSDPQNTVTRSKKNWRVLTVKRSEHTKTQKHTAKDKPFPKKQLATHTLFPLPPTKKAVEFAHQEHISPLHVSSGCHGGEQHLSLST